MASSPPESLEDNAEPAAITTVRVSAKKALPKLYKKIRDDIVPKFAEWNVLANMLAHIYIPLMCKDENKSKLMNKNSFNSTLHQRLYRSVSTLDDELTDPPDDNSVLQKAVATLRAMENMQNPKSYPARDGLNRLLQQAADQHELTCRQHVLRNFNKWLQRWLFVQAFEELGGWGNDDGENKYVSGSGQQLHKFLHRCPLSGSKLKQLAYALRCSLLAKQAVPKLLTKRVKLSDEERAQLERMLGRIKTEHKATLAKATGDYTYHQAYPLIFSMLGDIERHTQHVDALLEPLRNQYREEYISAKQAIAPSQVRNIVTQLLLISHQGQQHSQHKLHHLPKRVLQPRRCAWAGSVHTCNKDATQDNDEPLADVATFTDSGEAAMATGSSPSTEVKGAARVIVTHHPTVQGHKSQSPSDEMAHEMPAQPSAPGGLGRPLTKAERNKKSHERAKRAKKTKRAQV